MPSLNRPCVLFLDFRSGFWTLLALGALVLVIETSNANADRKPGCTATREFVASMEFLRSRKDLAVPEEQARTIAEKVALGCSGSGLRFIRLVQVLSRAGVGANNAVNTGVEF